MRHSQFAPQRAELPPTIDDDALTAIKTDVLDDHVAAPADRNPEQLAAIVADARDRGTELTVVVIPGNPGQDVNLRDLASEIGKTEPGTVAVFSDDWIGTHSDTVSRVRLEWAEDAAKSRQGNSVEAVQIFIDRLEHPTEFPWTAVTCAILLGTAATIAGLYWVKARRAKMAGTAAADHEAEE